MADTMLHEGAVKSSQIECMSGYAQHVMDRYPIGENDVLLAVSTSGLNPFPIEMADAARKKGAKVIVITSGNYAGRTPCTADGRHLSDAVICVRFDGAKAGSVSSMASIFIADSIMLSACESLRSIPLPRTFLDALQPDGQSGFILHKPDGSPLSYTMFAKMLKRALKRIGFEDGRYTAHDFRATCATEWLEAGIPLKTISAMLGHRDTRTTERYCARLRPEVAYEGVAERIDAHLRQKQKEIDTIPA